MKWVRRVAAVVFSVVLLIGIASVRPVRAVTVADMPVGDLVEAFDVPCSSWSYGSSVLGAAVDRGSSGLSDIFVNYESVADTRAAVNVARGAWGQGWDVDSPVVGWRNPGSLAETAAMVRCLSLLGVKVNNMGDAAVLGSNGALSKKLDSLASSVQGGVSYDDFASLSNSLDSVLSDLGSRIGDIDSSLSSMSERLAAMSGASSPGDVGRSLALLEEMSLSLSHLSSLLDGFFDCDYRHSMERSFSTMGILALKPMTVNPVNHCKPRIPGVDRVKEAVDEAKKAIETADRAARAAAKGLGDKIQESGQTVGDAVKKFWDKLTGKDGLSRLEQAAKDAAERAAKAIGKASEATQKGISQLRQGIQDLKDGITDLGQSIKDGMRDLSESLGEKIDGLARSIRGGSFSGPGIGSVTNGGSRLESWRDGLRCLSSSLSGVGSGNCDVGPVIPITDGVQWRPFSWCGSDMGWSHVKTLIGVLMVIGSFFAAFSAILASLGVSFRMGGGTQ